MITKGDLKFLIAKLDFEGMSDTQPMKFEAIGAIPAGSVVDLALKVEYCKEEAEYSYDGTNWIKTVIKPEQGVLQQG